MEVFELYGGAVFLEYEPVKHTYRVCIKDRRYKVPSVTKITGIVDKSGPLIPWAINSTLDLVREAILPDTPYPGVLLEEIYAQAKREAQRRKSSAAERGTLVHEILSRTDGVDQSDLVGQFDESILRRVDLGRKWLEENHVELECIERPIYSRRYKYSGRFDGVGKIKGKKSLFDWKTGKGIYSEFLLQTAGYQYAYEEETGEVIDQRVILHLGEDKVTPYYFPRTSYRKHLSGFLGAKKLFDQVQAIDKQLRKMK